MVGNNLIFSQTLGAVHVPIAWIPTPGSLLLLGLWNSTVWSYWVSAIIKSRVLCEVVPMCIQDSSHKTGAYKVSFLDKGEDPCNPRALWVALASPTATFNGLYSPTRCILLYFSSAQWLKKLIKYTAYRLCVLQSALHHRAMSRQTFHSFHSDSAPSPAGAPRQRHMNLRWWER